MDRYELRYHHKTRRKQVAICIVELATFQTLKHEFFPIVLLLQIRLIALRTTVRSWPVAVLQIIEIHTW